MVIRDIAFSPWLFADDNGADFGERPLQIVVNNNIIKAFGICDFRRGALQAAGDCSGVIFFRAASSAFPNPPKKAGG